MTTYRISITDCKGKTTTFTLDRPLMGQANWRALDCSAFRCDDGVATTGYDPVAQLSWLALYAGPEAVDKNLVFHLDGFCTGSGDVQEEGKGKIYHSDTIVMAVGPLTWKLMN
jgi:hypothetical protein